jgi:hypothetical protein
MTAGRINQVSISTPSRRCVTIGGCCYLPSFNSVRLSSPHSQSDDTYSRHRLANVRMHQLRYECTNFALKAAQLELSKSAWSTASFQSPFLAHHLVHRRRTGPHRAARRRRRATDIALISSRQTEKRHLFSFSSRPGEYRTTLVTSHIITI